MNASRVTGTDTIGISFVNWVKFDQPSSTARLIAQSLLFLSVEKKFRELMPEGMVTGTRHMAADNEIDRAQLTRRLGNPFVRWLVRTVESLVLPGIQLHYLLRKLAIENFVRTSIADGIKQVVILGAGLDTLAGRLHGEFPLTSFIEVDHPSTQEAKLRLLHDWRKTGGNLHFLPGDFSEQTLDKVLMESPHFESELSTLFIAEGLLMYMPSEKIDLLLRFVTTQLPANRIAFTYMDNQPPKGKPGFEGCRTLTNAWLRWKGEPFIWGLPKGEIVSFLQKHDLQLLEHFNAQNLPAKFLRKHNNLKGVKSISGESLACCSII
ncbi:MAG: class I SAM-dependent methyltransferase [Opitutae bacterium]|nr:class I SAM-dependent methyltransferase [Opitutae bacterium]